MSPTLVPPARDAAEQPWILLGPSREARRLRESLGRIAATPATTVLLEGPRDLARDAVAHALHLLSNRRAGPFVRLRAADLSAEELERSLGRARGGTLVVEEIAELPPSLQPVLASALAAAGERSGEGRDGPRLVATSACDLDELAREGRFDSELSYRINVLSLRVPALSERREDLPQLARRILAEEARELGHALLWPGEDFEAALSAHDWPGGLRELVNALQRAALHARDGRPRVEDLALPRRAATPPPEQDLLPLADRSLRSLEQALIRRVLEDVRGNKSRAARVLGVDRTTLYSKLRQYGL